MNKKIMDLIKKETNILKNAELGKKIAELSEEAQEEDRTIVAAFLARLAPIFAVGEVAIVKVIDECGEMILIISTASENTMEELIEELDSRNKN